MSMIRQDHPRIDMKWLFGAHLCTHRLTKGVDVFDQ